MVRDEADIVRISVLHHLSLGLEEVLVVDNGSSDGTDRVLAALARRHPVRWTRDDSGYRQAELVSGLADAARRRGATWVVPFDADELWLPARPLAKLLAGAPAAVLGGEVRNYVQARRELVSRSNSLLSMTRRVRAPVGAYEDAQRRVETEEIAFVEMPYPDKVVARAVPELTFAHGSHAVVGAEEDVVRMAELVCLHAPLRSRAALERKAVAGRRSEAAGHEPEINWHLKRWARLADRGRLDEEWTANSYDADGCLDAWGRRPRLVEDPTLARLAQRFV